MMRSLISICILICSSLLAHTQSKNYYISSSGDDDNSGRFPAAAWKSVAMVNALDLNPGDTLFFKGGEIHTGTVELTKEDVAYRINPIVITSYGQGRATIKADEGISAHNTAGI